MRPYLVFVIIPIFIQACAPKPVFRMSPVAEHTTFDQGTEYVHLQEEGISLTLSYYRHLGKRFVMDVEIVNETDSVLRVDPGHFFYEAYRFNQAEKPWEQDNVIASGKAINPEQELLRKDMAFARKVADQKTSSLLFAVGQAASVAHSIAEDDPEKREELSEQRQENYISYESGQLQRERQKDALRDSRKVWEVDALRTTDLHPGEYIRGFVFFKNEPDARGYLIAYKNAKAAFNIFYRQIKYKP